MPNLTIKHPDRQPQKLNFVVARNQLFIEFTKDPNDDGAVFHINKDDLLKKQEETFWKSLQDLALKIDRVNGVLELVKYQDDRSHYAIASHVEADQVIFFMFRVDGDPKEDQLIVRLIALPQLDVLYETQPPLTKCLIDLAYSTVGEIVIQR